MTPKEKAKELISKFCQVYVWDSSMPNEFNEDFSGTMPIQIAKECALIAVEEVLNGEQAAYSFPVEMGQFFIDYWNDVKKEIELL